MDRIQSDFLLNLLRFVEILCIIVEVLSLFVEILRVFVEILCVFVEILNLFVKILCHCGGLEYLWTFFVNLWFVEVFHLFEEVFVYLWKFLVNLWRLAEIVCVIMKI